MIINQTVTSSSSGGGWEIGDMLYTERVPDMNKWLECDGTHYNTHDYKELYNLIGTKYGSTGDAATKLMNNQLTHSVACASAITLPNGKLTFDYLDADNYHRRAVYDSKTGTKTVYPSSDKSISNGTRELSPYRNTAVVLDNGDVICQCKLKNCLSRISNIDDPEGSITRTDITGYTFGKRYQTGWSSDSRCAAQIVYDEVNSRYIILAPKNNEVLDEDDSLYWDGIYKLDSTTDFVTFTTISSSINYSSSYGLHLHVANKRVFLSPYGTSSSTPIYELVENSLVSLGSTTKTLGCLTYVNGYYFASEEKGTSSVSAPGLYRAGDDLQFAKIYTNDTWDTIFYGTGGGNSTTNYSYLNTTMAAYSDTEILIISSWMLKNYTSSSNRRHRGSVFKVNDDGSLTLKHTFFSTTGDGLEPSWCVTDGIAAVFYTQGYIYGTSVYPQKFAVPTATQAYGGSGAATTSPTPYIRAKD